MTRLSDSPHDQHHFYIIHTKWKHTRELKGMKINGLIVPVIPNKWKPVIKSRNQAENK